MKIKILTLFPDEMRGIFLKGLYKKASEAGFFDIEFINIRDFANCRNNRVDDYPYGYRKGMILQVDVLERAVKSIDNYDSYRLLYTCPKGPAFTQEIATEFQQEKGLIIISGYYEGVDERLFKLFDIDKISAGDFVLSSGEYPSLIITEAVLRLIPGVIGNADCIKEDSIVSGLLECPQYTAPREFSGEKVPEVLLNGNHNRINSWRHKMAIKETLFNKPELFIKYDIKQSDQKIIVDLLKTKLAFEEDLDDGYIN
ncbi:MAG: tRNA (guanosine(37)-N1)-methyltransferase TrmD [bacterium]|nr:tRNA (guanosine(37)-N1)-methyltransferase TrmD [bacterium]